MKYAVIFVVLSAFISWGASNLNIAPADDGTDLMWVSWTDAGDTGAVARYNGATPEDARFFFNCPDGVSSALTFDAIGGMHLIFSNRDSLLSLDPLGTMSTVDVIAFYEMSEWCRTGLLRRSADPEYGLLGRYMASFMSSGADFYWHTREYTVSATGEIIMGDSLILEDPYPLQGSDYPEELVPMTFPVMNQTGNPVMSTRQLLPGGPMPPTPSSLRIATQCHNTTAPSVYLTADTLTCSTSNSPGPVLMASGSNSTEALFLWSDSTQTVYFSLHDCNTGISATSQYTGEGPLFSKATAISANPADPGLLLVWYDNGDILCRHYEDGWNDYAYVIAEGIANIQPDNIAVCSVENGYWVGYLLSSNPYPFLFFVSRDDVTEIEEHSGAVPQLEVNCFPNPFSETLSVIVSGDHEQIGAELFDHCGRVVRRSFFSGNILLWNTFDLPTGCYFIRITADDEVFSEKAVLVR